jgi:hypothetical protein
VCRGICSHTLLSVVNNNHNPPQTKTKTEPRRPAAARRRLPAHSVPQSFGRRRRGRRRRGRRGRQGALFLLRVCVQRGGGGGRRRGGGERQRGGPATAAPSFDRQNKKNHTPQPQPKSTQFKAGDKVFALTPGYWFDTTDGARPARFGCRFFWGKQKPASKTQNTLKTIPIKQQQCPPNKTITKNKKAATPNTSPPTRPGSRACPKTCRSTRRPACRSSL